MSDIDPETWGTAAEWVAAVGTVGALMLTFRLLRHEIGVRRDVEQADAVAAQRDVARRIHSTVREMLDHWPGSTSPERCAQLARDLRLIQFELTNQAILSRVRSTQVVAFTLASNDEAFAKSSSPIRPMTRQYAILRFRLLLDTTANSLERFIVDSPLPAWPEELPEQPAAAQSWIWTAPA